MAVAGRDGPPTSHAPWEGGLCRRGVPPRVGHRLESLGPGGKPARGLERGRGCGLWHAFCAAVNCQARRKRMSWLPASSAPCSKPPHRGCFGSCQQGILFLLVCTGTPRCTEACQSPSRPSTLSFRISSWMCHRVVGCGRCGFRVARWPGCDSVGGGLPCAPDAAARAASGVGSVVGGGQLDASLGSSMMVPAIRDEGSLGLGRRERLWA